MRTTCTDYPTGSQPCVVMEHGLHQSRGGELSFHEGPGIAEARTKATAVGGRVIFGIPDGEAVQVDAESLKRPRECVTGAAGSVGSSRVAGDPPAASRTVGSSP